MDVSNVAQDSKIRLREWKRREWYSQNQLKTLRQYGGMNIREERLWIKISVNYDIVDNAQTHDPVVLEPSGHIEGSGCSQCKPLCKACKLFIQESKTAQSVHADYIVNIKGRIDCNIEGVCYLINDSICRRSSVVSTINNFKTRWRNHKAHVK